MKTKSPEQSIHAFYAALLRMRERGVKTFSAQTLAQEMWPSARASNTSGQVFNLNSGIAGKMLRAHRACVETKNRVWEIVPEFLEEDMKTQPTSSK